MGLEGMRGRTQAQQQRKGDGRTSTTGQCTQTECQLVHS